MINVKWMRIAAASQVILGHYLLVFGIGNQATYRYREQREFTAECGIAIWTGLLTSATGVTGLVASRRSRITSPSKRLFLTFLVGSIASALLSVTMAISHALVLMWFYRRGCERFRLNSNNFMPEPKYSYYSTCTTGLAVNALLLSGAMIEVATAILSVVLFSVSGCCSGTSPVEHPAQIVYRDEQVSIEAAPDGPNTREAIIEGSYPESAEEGSRL